MTIEKFRDLMQARPFMPFALRLADGRRIPVDAPDFVSTSQTGRVVHVFHGRGDASTFVDILLVTALELNQKKRTRQAS